VFSRKEKGGVKDMSLIDWLEIQKMKLLTSCCNCKFFDGSCCMYNCMCFAVLDEEETAKNCEYFKLGEYNQDELEKTDYK
jgi:hypothetical protein